MLNISVIAVVLIILIIHTVLSHLLNWVVRIMMDDDSELFIPIMIITIEFLLIFFWLATTIENYGEILKLQ